MWELLHQGRALAEALNSPFLVERVQNYFGVHRLTAAKNGHPPNGALRNGYARKVDASVACRVERRRWYYLFRFGSLLGYEAFYATFFPFIVWNWDPVVSRRVLLVWAVVMYCGGLAKDLLRWSRPASPPVVQFDRAYAAEFGMPSTHAMTGASVPFGLLLFTQGRYEASHQLSLASRAATIRCHATRAQLPNAALCQNRGLAAAKTARRCSTKFAVVSCPSDGAIASPFTTKGLMMSVDTPRVWISAIRDT
ncbi:hypothetical protein V5799_009368 [Amblyomma americanum]|uniref:Sphingosine-1-phosphate phosphatase 2 n=1 Tax=Amblyomma americanum TaxID=6943 RepID=A0AAQ4FCF6_AMBAM